MKNMKTLLFIPFSLCLFVANCNATPQAPSKVLLAQVQSNKIAAVTSGTLKTAHANWWGFDKEDATNALQTAINSGVPKLIVDNMGSDWIVNKPIRLHSDQEIVFKNGVVIQAEKGRFKAVTDSLFLANNISNFKLIGQGNVVFRMHRADYDNPDLYTKAEWRSGINVRNCRNVVIRNLTVTETGGDGLYLGANGTGYNKNVLVENCQFVNNYRQGISVISAEDLTIRNCKLNNTAGTAPQAGIDFEPNAEGQRLVNCILQDCELSGNKGAGLDIYTIHLRGTAQPISITLENCRIAGNAVGMSATASSYPDNVLTGKVLLKDCIFDNSEVRIGNPVVGGVKYVFDNCVLDFSERAVPVTPITLDLDLNMESHAIGGIAFNNTTIKAAKADPIKITFQGIGTLSNQITGTLFLKNAEKAKPVDLSTFINQEQKRIAKAKAHTLSIAEELKRRSTKLHRIAPSQVPCIDGKLDEKIYNKLPWLKPFGGFIEQKRHAAPQVSTRAFVAYDAKNVYIAVRCAEPSMTDQIIKGNTRDSNIWAGECIDIAILKLGQPTDDVSGEFYHFILNPRNIQWDAINTGTSAALDYNPKWQSATSRNANGWIAEIAIPWQDIGVADACKGLHIHANIARRRMADTLEYSSWSQYVSGFQEPQHLGTWVLK